MGDQGQVQKASCGSARQAANKKEIGTAAAGVPVRGVFSRGRVEVQRLRLSHLCWYNNPANQKHVSSSRTSETLSCRFC